MQREVRPLIIVTIVISVTPIAPAYIISHAKK